MMKIRVIKQFHLLAICLMGMATTAPVLGATHYVDLASQSPSPPYTTWATAATNIQDAVDVSMDGDTVWVGNGHYLLSAEIRVANTITLRSINGPIPTVIDGQGHVRCFNLGGRQCIINGFTIINGYHVSGSYPDNCGGGVYCSTMNPEVRDCRIKNNYSIHGGGMYQGTAKNCTFSGNTAANMGGGMRYGEAYDCNFNNNTAGHHAGGLYSGTAVNCVFNQNSARSGGGMLNGVANICVFSNNVATGSGGGMFFGTANNCLFINNKAGNGYPGMGGGLFQSTANNCTIVGNSANGEDTWMKGIGGGIIDGEANNCIIWGNWARGNGNDLYDTAVTNSCSLDVSHGLNGNITTPPLFMDETGANYRLQLTSPCMNAGNNSLVTYGLDLDRHPRILDNTVDMGAYENGFEGCFITNIVQTGDQVLLQWTAFPMCKSVIYRTANLQADFQPLEPGIEYPLNSYTATVHSTENQYFYQVQLNPNNVFQ